MAHVVMQAAEFSSVEDAMRAVDDLQRLIDAYIAFERSDPDPWNRTRVPPPLIEFGARHQVAWPLAESSRFLLKGLFDDVAKLVRVDRIVFFYGGGFELGGETLREIIRGMGAVHCTAFPHLVVRCEDPTARADELAELLFDDEYDDQFTLETTASDETSALFRITLERKSEGQPNGQADMRRLVFDDSGVQDWAFVSLLARFTGEDPRLLRTPSS